MPLPVNYFHVIYLDARAANATTVFPERVDAIRRWTWRQSGSVRWHRVRLRDTPPQITGIGFVVITEESATVGARDQIKHVHGVFGKCPILVCSRSPREQDKNRARDQEKEARTTYDNPKSLELIWANQPEEVECARALRNLHVALPPVREVVHWRKEDWAFERLMEDVPKADLNLLLAKLFPAAPSIMVSSVHGGWSGAMLCHLAVEGDNTYYLKIAKDSATSILERKQHVAAQSWLGEATVPLRTIPHPDTDQVDVYLEAGPACASRTVCYLSADDPKHPREPLQKIYRMKETGFVQEVTRNVLDVLLKKKGEVQTTVDPWPESGLHELTSHDKANIKGALADLDSYGCQLYGNNRNLWDHARDSVIKLVHGHLPEWLTQPIGVVQGPVHGDPNCRNILVSPGNSKDFKIIDCSGYCDCGRVVHDLALMEWDTKCVLMGTEANAPAFHDIDTEQLIKWCDVEKQALTFGIGFGDDDANRVTKAEADCVQRAYSIVAMIRQRACELCRAAKDEEGRHYFSGLLYWSLKSLGESAVRRAKKLLALYSAAAICGGTWRWRNCSGHL